MNIFLTTCAQASIIYLLLLLGFRYSITLSFNTQQLVCASPSIDSRLFFHAKNENSTLKKSEKGKSNYISTQASEPCKNSSNTLKNSSKYFLKRSFPKMDKVLSSWWLL